MGRYETLAGVDAPVEVSEKLMPPRCLPLDASALSASDAVKRENTARQREIVVPRLKKSNCLHCVE
jgi:hypothetical protein